MIVWTVSRSAGKLLWSSCTKQKKSLLKKETGLYSYLYLYPLLLQRRRNYHTLGQAWPKKQSFDYHHKSKPVKEYLVRNKRVSLVKSGQLLDLEASFLFTAFLCFQTPNKPHALKRKGSNSLQAYLPK